MNKTLKIFIGVLISSACLWFVFRGFNFHELLLAFDEANYFWIAPAAAIFILNMTLRSFRWQTLLSPIKKIPILNVIPVLLFGFFMNNILPARGGEIVRGVAMAKRTGIPASSTLGSIVAERLTDMLGLLMIIFLAAHLLPLDKLPVRPFLSILCLGIAGSAGLFVFTQRRRKMKESSQWVEKLLDLVSNVMAGFLALKSYSKMATVTLLSCAIWIDELLLALFISRAMHVDLSFFEAAGLLTGISVGVMIPAGPGYIGTYEFFGNEALKMLGIISPRTLPFLFVLHFFQLTMMALVALPCIFALKSRTRLEPQPQLSPIP